MTYLNRHNKKHWPDNIRSRPIDPDNPDGIALWSTNLEQVQRYGRVKVTYKRRRKWSLENA